MRLEIDSWRWSGVPFYLRAGKCLPVTATEVVVDLRPPPAQVFGELGPEQPNYLRFRVGPDVAIALGAHAKKAGPTMQGATWSCSSRSSRADEMDAYERLISSAIIGDTVALRAPGRSGGGLGDRRSGAGDRSPVHEYTPGTWGPPEAEAIITPGPAAGTTRARSAHLDALLSARGL